jgi:hypothetical protein
VGQKIGEAAFSVPQSGILAGLCDELIPLILRMYG